MLSMAIKSMSDGSADLVNSVSTKEVHLSELKVFYI
jgi:hypothetical protein